MTKTGVIRTTFYTLIFLTSFFFAQIYTAGLFIGLAFWSLALMKRKWLVWAGILAIFATWTRAQGAALSLPMLIAWLTLIDWKKPFLRQFSWKWAALGMTVLMPVAAYLIWRNSSLGLGWQAAPQPEASIEPAHRQLSTPAVLALVGIFFLAAFGAGRLMADRAKSKVF